MEKIKSPFIIAITLMALIFAVSCSKNSTGDVTSSQLGLKLFLTDGPSISFDSIFIDIQKVDIKIERQDGTEIWQNLPVQPGIYNILRLRNGVEVLLANVNIPNGKVEKLKLTLGTRNSAVKSGTSYPLALHNNINEFTINIDDDVDDDGDASHKKFWLDFDGAASIIETSPGHFELSPSLHHFSHHSSAELEGKVRPNDAQPILVYAIAGADTLTTRTEAEGEFKFRGIHTTTVKLIIHPSNNYRDSVINNVHINQGEDTNLGTIVLHR